MLIRSEQKKEVDAASEEGKTRISATEGGVRQVDVAPSLNSAPRAPKYHDEGGNEPT